MALVPALAHYLAPGSVRYDPSNQPKNKNSKLSIQRLNGEVNPLSSIYIKKQQHKVKPHLNTPCFNL